MASNALTNEQLINTIKGTTAQGWSGPAIINWLSQLGYTKRSFVSQLQTAGYTSAQANKIATAPGSEIKNLLAQAGSAAIPVPGVGAGIAEAGAAEGTAAAEGAAGGVAAGSATSLASKAVTGLETAGVIAGIWEALTDPQNWVRALEILGAAVAIYLGIRGLAGGYS